MNTPAQLSAFFMALLLCSTFLSQSNAQHSDISNTYSSQGLNNSILFGNDVIINNEAIQDQKNVIVRSAFNGWLFAVYTYLSSGDEFPALTILKSTDNGLSWVVLSDFFLPFDDSEFRSVDFVVCGNTVSNLKIILAELIVNRNSTTGIGIGYVLRVNGETGLYEDELYSSGQCFSISLATDFMFPATNSNPYSIGCLTSSIPTSVLNSVKFHSSSNGGLSFDMHIEVAGTLNRFTKVALSYGRSLSGNTGRYFATWEEKTDFSAPVGHIYTAHSDPFFNSDFTTPVLIDSLVTGNYNMVRNPSIACQVNNINNDSSDITQVIVFEKMSSIPGQYEIHGVFNKKAGLSDHFTPFIPDQTGGNKVSPSVLFNPFDSIFILTYYNATEGKLPLLRNDYNLLQPDNWILITSGYNDDNTLMDPNPELALNVGLRQEVCTWTGVGNNNHGVALFDAYYVIPSVDQTDNSAGSFSVLTWPNPCTDNLNIEVKLEYSTEVNITLYSILGAPVSYITNEKLQKGHHFFNLSCSNLINGQFLLNIRTNNSVKTIPIVVNH